MSVMPIVHVKNTVGINWKTMSNIIVNAILNYLAIYHSSCHLKIASIRALTLNYANRCFLFTCILKNIHKNM